MLETDAVGVVVGGDDDCIRSRLSRPGPDKPPPPAPGMDSPDDDAGSGYWWSQKKMTPTCCMTRRQKNNAFSSWTTFTTKNHWRLALLFFGYVDISKVKDISICT